MGRSNMIHLLIFMSLVASNLFSIGVASRAFEDDQKTYYSPPSGSHGSTTPPPHGHGGGSTPHPSDPPPPHHGGGGYTPSYPSPPHHGGGGYTPTPSTPNCGTPPSHGGGSHTPRPSTPTPVIVSPPSHGGGSYTPRPSTPTPVIVSPPTTPVISTPPIDPGTPYISTPPVDPGTPSIPTPPFFPSPSGPFGGTCDFWRNHPTLIWGVMGWFGTVGSSLGVPSVPGFGSSMTLHDALSNTRHDGFGQLYRQGTAALLNSMANHSFTYTTKQVRESFVAALSSNKAAAAQARIFKLANEGLRS